MNPAELGILLGKLGIEGIDPTKLSTVMSLMQELGKDVEVSPSGVKSYFPKVDDSYDFYIPKMPKGFYTGAFENLRKLITPRFPKMR